MKNEKIFVGNLNFSATEDDVKGLLSEYGTVVNIRYSRKKGHAVAEMSDRDESEAVIRNLDGKNFMERTLRVNFELPSKKAKAESVKRFNEKGKSIAEEKSEALPKERKKDSSRDRGQKNSGGRSSEKPSDRHKQNQRDGHRGSAPKGNRRDDDDDSRGNRKSSYDSDFSRERDSVGGYYSQSFRKRAEKAAQAFTKFRTKGSYSEPKDDFMKDEHGRDYRDMNDESGRRRPSRGGQGPQGRSTGNRERTRQGADSERSYGERRDSARRAPRREDGENSGRPQRSSSGRPSGNRGDSRPGSGHGESRDGSRRNSGRPNRSGERTGNSGERSGGDHRRGGSQGERGNSSSRRSSGSRPSDRSRNKQQ